MSLEKIALFPGSFDPFTNGHLNTVERAANIFDQVYISIVTNTTKQALFTLDEKLDLAQKATKHLENVSVIVQEEGLTVDLAKKLQANFLVRGIRNATDYEYEKNIAFMNSQLNEQVETVFLLSHPEFSNVSSSIIKEIAYFGGDISAFVPQCVHQAILEKYHQN